MSQLSFKNDHDGKDGGFSLIEIVVAFMIVAIALVPLIQLFLSGMGATRINSHMVEATSFTSDQIEFNSSLPNNSVGYFEDEFSSSNPLYPTSGAEKTAFDKLFGTSYLAGTTFPATIPSQGLTVDLGALSPQSPPTPSTDLIEPVVIKKAEGETFYIFTLVSWESTVTPADTSSDCSYKEITVVTFWNNWTQHETQSTQEYPTGAGVNTDSSLAPGTTCNGSALLSSTSPAVPTAVTVSSMATNPNGMQVAWTETQSSGDGPVGYFVVEWSVDPNFVTDQETSAIEIPSSTDINQVVVSSSTSTYTYYINDLAPDSTYYVRVFAYSQDGSNLVISNPASTIYPGGAGNGFSTPASPPDTSCIVEDLFATAIPPVGVSPTANTPVISSKLYLTPTGSSPEDVYFGINTANSCNTTVAGGFSVGLGYYSTTSPFSPIDVFPLNTGFAPAGGTSSSGVIYLRLQLASTASTYAKAGYYELVLDQGTGISAPAYGNPQPTSTFLICPYVPPAQRTQVENKC